VILICWWFGLAIMR